MTLRKVLPRPRCERELKESLRLRELVSWESDLSRLCVVLFLLSAGLLLERRGVSSEASAAAAKVVVVATSTV